MKIKNPIDPKIIPQMRTSFKSLSTRITISQDWKGLPLSMLTPFILLLFPASDANTTGELIKKALSRRMCSIRGRKGPPRTT